MGLITEAEPSRDVRDMRAAGQELACVIEPERDDVGVRRDAELALVGAEQHELVGARSRAELVEGGR